MIPTVSMAGRQTIPAPRGRVAWTIDKFIVLVGKWAEPIQDELTELLEQEYFFSVNDIVEVLTESTDVKQYIKRMRSRDPELNTRWGTICTPTRMRAADGKYYKTQAATMKGILRIVQSIPSRKAEPLKQWLAEVGRSVISSAKASDYISPSQEPELLEGGDNNKD